jgi:hypothetical protein
MAKLNIAVKWSDGAHSIQRIKRYGSLPLKQCPRHLLVPGGKVAVVQSGGVVGLIFECKSIEGPLSITLVNGSRHDRGYILRAKQGTMHRPHNGEPSQFKTKWYAIGQFRYFRYKSWKRFFVNGYDGDGEHIPEPRSRVSDNFLIPRRPYSGGIPGIPRDNPEARLVDEYVAWIAKPEHFENRYLRGPGLWTDLFDPSRWRLIEAKASIDRKTLRTAVGQLFDYRRFFLRKPSLGILLPARPSESCLDFISAYNITAIWRTPTGRFSDSTGNKNWAKRG